MIERNQVHEGMVVFGSDGRRLGRVRSADEGGFTVHKRFLVPTDYLAHYDDVAAISEEEIRLLRSRNELAHTQHKPACVEAPPPEAGSYGDEGGGGRS